MAFPLFVLIGFAMASTTIGATALLRDRRSLAALCGLLGATGLLAFVVYAHVRLFPVDDAYIIFRYSRNLADGLGPNWNGEGRVEGYTSFLWMALLAALSKLGLDILDGARVLSWLSLLASFGAMAGVWRLWASEHPGGIDSPLVLALAAVALAITDGAAYLGFSGMETPLFMALLTVGGYLHLLERRCAAPPWSALVFVAAAMTRPEGLVAATVTGGFVAASALQTRKRRDLARAAAWLALFSSLYGAYFLWRYTYYDALLPNTFYAKVGPSGAILERGGDYIVSALLNYHILALLAGAALLLTIPRLRWDGAYIITATAAMLGTVALEGGDAFGHGRFIVPILPFVYLSGLAGFAMLLARLSLTSVQAALLAAAVLSVAGLILLRGSDNPHIPKEREAHEERRILGEWLRDNTPPEYTIAAFAVGSVAYYSERDFLDLLGLNDTVIARSEVPGFGKGIAGHERYNVDYALRHVRPEIILTGDADPRPLTASELRTAGGLPAKVAYLRSEELWEQYDVRSINIDGRWFTFLQRRDTRPRRRGRFHPASGTLLP
jgi:arabinofuranosyltransferase